MIGNPDNNFQKNISELGLILNYNGNAGTSLPDNQILYLQENYSFPRNKIWNNKSNEDKRNIFSLSGCDTSLLKANQTSGQVKFNLWRLFGKNGEGAVIVFKIANNQSNWKDFHIGKINYGPSVKGRLKKIYKSYLELKKQHKDYYHIDFRKLFPFYKSNLYKPENEIRIIYDFTKKLIGNIEIRSPKDIFIFPDIKEDMEKTYKKYSNNREENKIKYISLPLTEKGFEQIDGEDSPDWNAGIPKLKIHKIILGFQYKDEIWRKLILDEITDLIKTSLDYSPSIELSRFIKSYW